MHDLPDYVYFDHSIHVNKGIGCSSCHGRIDEMPLTYQASTLQMEWCLNCHRNPAKNLRPTSQIYQMAWEGPSSLHPVWCTNKPTTPGVPTAQLVDCTREILTMMAPRWLLSMRRRVLERVLIRPRFPICSRGLLRTVDLFMPKSPLTHTS